MWCPEPSLRRSWCWAAGIVVGRQPVTVTSFRVCLICKEMLCWRHIFPGQPRQVKAWSPWLGTDYSHGNTYSWAPYSILLTLRSASQFNFSVRQILFCRFPLPRVNLEETNGIPNFVLRSVSGDTTLQHLALITLQIIQETRLPNGLIDNVVQNINTTAFIWEGKSWALPNSDIDSW